MGQVQKRRVVVLILLLVLCVAAARAVPAPGNIRPGEHLDAALQLPGNWVRGESYPPSPLVIRALKLDDYVSRDYINGNRTVNLYVGYYDSAKKVGAAHSPLVCFPGQGWVLSNKRAVSLRVNDKEIRVATMIASRGDSKALVVYWFQAYDRTFAGTFAQKLYEFWCALSNRGEGNAFVRVIVNLHHKSEKQAFAVASSFIDAFYPVFLHYVTHG